MTTVLVWVALTLFHGTVLTLLTWLLVSTLLRRARPALHAGLWTVVLLKFLIPPAIPVPSGLSAWLAPYSRGLLHPWLEDPTTALPEAAGMIAPGPTVPSLEAPAVEVSLLLATGIYLAGLGLLAWTFLRRTWTTRRWVDSLPSAPVEVQEAVLRLAQRLKLRRIPEVRLADCRVSPFVMGVLRPRLVVPAYLITRFESAMRDALFVHELAHLRRGDVLLRWIQGLARMLLFFWPPVRWACRGLERAAELACDQWAVTVSRVDPEIYARALLDIARCLKGSPAPYQHAALTRSTSILEERFAMLLHPPRRLTPGLSASTVVLLGLWAWFSLAGTAVYPEGVAGGPETVQKQVTLRLRGPSEHLLVHARLLPEADLDGDDLLTIEELRAFQAAHPDLLILQVEEADQGTQDISVEVRRFGPAADAAEGSGVAVGAGIGIGEQSAEWSAGAAEAADILFLHSAEEATAGEDSHMTSRGLRKAIRVAGPVELLRRHPEADLDGDGKLNGEELHRLFEQLTPEALAPEAGEGPAADFVVEIEAAGASPEEVIRWESKGEGPAGEKKIMIIRRVLEQKPAAAAPAPLSPEQRRQEFLRTHPEADQDGDGVISEKEAEALAAKARKSGGE